MNRKYQIQEPLQTYKTNFVKPIPNHKNNKSEPILPCEQQKSSQININSRKLYSTQIFSTPSISRLFSPRQKETDMILFETNYYQHLFIAISQLEIGVKIILTVESTHNQTTLISCTLSTIEVEKAKVKHSFPMPILFKSTRLIKIIFTTFFYEQQQFSIVVQSINKGKIKKKNVLLNLPLEQQWCSNYHSVAMIIEIDPFKLIEQAENLRKKKFIGTQKQFNLTTSKSATYLENTGKSRRTQIQISKLENERAIENLLQQKKITNFTESVFKYKNSKILTNQSTPIIEQMQAQNFRTQNIRVNKIKFPFMDDIVKKNNKKKEQKIKNQQELKQESQTIKIKQNNKNLINKQKSPAPLVLAKSNKNSRTKLLSELADPEIRKKLIEKSSVHLLKIQGMKSSETISKKIIPKSLKDEEKKAVLSKKF